MDTEKLRALLRQNESATLEFKREMYGLDNRDGHEASKQKHEFVKDILALANGNANVAGETAYLVIGADNSINAAGERDVFDIGEVNLSPTRVLDTVNNFCDPPISEIRVYPIVYQNKHVLVIEIPPSPYVYETTNDLKPKRGEYPPYVVFVRYGEKIAVASWKEQDTLRLVKKIRYESRHNVPPMKYGVISGAISGAAIGVSLRGVKEDRAFQIGRGIVGAILGAFFNGALGWVYENWIMIQPDMARLSRRGQVGFFSAWIIVTVIIARLADRLLKRVLKRGIKNQK